MLFSKKIPHKSHRHTYSLLNIIKTLSLIAIPVVIINVIVCILSIWTIRQQNIDYISNTVALYQEETANKIKSTERLLQWTVVQEPLIQTIEKSTAYSEKFNAINAFRSRISDSQYATGSEYQYFLYLQEQDLFMNASPLHLNYANYLYFKDYILSKVQDGTAINSNYTWQSLQIDDEYYLLNSIVYKNRTFLTLVSVNDLLSSLYDTNIGNDGILFASDLRGNKLIDISDSKLDDISNHNRFFYNYLFFEGENAGLPYNLHIYVGNFSNFQNLILIQIFVMLTSLALVFTLGIFLLYMYRKVIKPIHGFSQSLTAINEQTDILDLQNSSIMELEQTNQQFKNLMREIKKLKISIYEQELDKKKTQIDFLQRQIRPHFYLNCLTTISSMAQLQRYEDIESMVLFTSQYLRYLFQTNKDKVRLEYELNHIQAYLDIQALRYGPVFSYTCTVEDKTTINALIPPLILITFVENIIKHTSNSTDTLHIHLFINSVFVENCKKLHITIEDSGQGFSEEILEQLSNKQGLSMDNNAHIGITNSMRRLDLIFTKDYELNFSNLPTGGAKVELIIPYITTDTT